MTLINNVEE